GRWYALAAAAVVTQSVIVVGWHAPAAFDAALRTDPLHGLEHLSMLGGTTALWWVLAGTRPLRRDSVVALFLSSLPLTALDGGRAVRVKRQRAGKAAAELPREHGRADRQHEQHGAEHVAHGRHLDVEVLRPDVLRASGEQRDVERERGDSECGAERSIARSV